MPADLEQQMLQILQSRSDTAAPLTIADFARIFGANRDLIQLCAQRMVDNGSALGSHVDRHGTARLHGLRPCSVDTPST
jgi:hypothetical protein